MAVACTWIHKIMLLTAVMSGRKGSNPCLNKSSVDSLVLRYLFENLFRRSLYYFICKGGASHLSASILHWSFHGHKFVSRPNQYRVHNRVQCTDLPGCRLLLFILCPGSDSVFA